MVVYLTVVVVIIFLSGVLRYQNSELILQRQKGGILTNYKACMLLISAILVCVAGLRYRVGADYLQYVSNYRAYCVQSLSWDGEPGIRVVSRLAKFIWDDYATMFFLMSLITVGLSTYTIGKYSPFFVVSILLYVFLGAWHESFNSMRQSAAAAVLFFGHGYIRDRKLVKWLIVCAVAFMFHISAFVFVPLYFVPYKKITWKSLLIPFAIGIVGGLSYDYAWDIIGAIRNKPYVLDIYSQSHISIYRILVAWVPITYYMIFYYKNQTERDLSMNFYAIISVMDAAIVLAARYSAYLGRLVIYLDMYNALFWAHMLSRLPQRRKNTNLQIIIIMVCYFFYYLYEASGPYLSTFRWIFSR